MPKPSSKRQRAGAATRTSRATRSRSASKSNETVVVVDNDDDDSSSSNQQKPLPRVLKASNTNGAIRVTVMVANSSSVKELNDDTSEVPVTTEPTATASDPNDDEQTSEVDTRASAKRRRTSTSSKSDASTTSDTAQEAMSAPDSAPVADSELPGQDDNAPGDSGALEPTPAVEDSVPPAAVDPESHDESSVEEQQPVQRSDEPMDDAPQSPDAPSAAAAPVDDDDKADDEAQSLAPHEPQDVDMAEDETQAQQTPEGDDSTDAVDQNADAEMHCDDNDHSNNETSPEPCDADVHAQAVETQVNEPAEAPEVDQDAPIASDASKVTGIAAATATTMDSDDKENDCNGAQVHLETSQEEVESLHPSPLHEVTKEPQGDTVALDTPEHLVQDAAPCEDPLSKTSSPAPPSGAPTAPTPQPSSLPAERKSKTPSAKKKPKRSAASSVSLASTRHLFQFTCKLLQSQRLEFEVRAREIEEKRAALATTREKLEKRIRSVKRQLRDYGHPVDEVEAPAAAAGAATASSPSSSAVNGSSSRAFVPSATAASALDPLALTANGDWSSALAGDGAPTSLITMRDAFTTRQQISSAGAATATSSSSRVDSHFPASIQALETQIRESLANRKRMVQDMLQDLDSGRRSSDVTAPRPR